MADQRISDVGRSIRRDVPHGGSVVRSPQGASREPEAPGGRVGVTGPGARLAVGRAAAALLLALAAACSGPHEQPTRPRGELPPGRHALFTAAQTEASLGSLRHCSDDAVAGVSRAWSPSPDALDEIEAQLAVALDSALGAVLPDESNRAREAQYYRQYMGVVRNGRRMILVNGFHEAHLAAMREIVAAHARRGDTLAYSPDDWVVQAVSVCDAGTHQFHAYYDPATATLGPIRFSDRLTGPVVQ